MFSTGSYTLLTQLHPSRKGTIVVSLHRTLYNHHPKEQSYVCCILFLVKGLMEFSMGFGFAIGAPIGGGLQEVREL